MFCDECGTEIPDVANFCWNCGTAARPGRPIHQASVLPARREICETGLVVVPGSFLRPNKYQFAARQGTQVIAQSEVFEHPGSPVSGDRTTQRWYKEGRSCLDRLMQSLAEAGWEHEGTCGLSYYEQRFSRVDR